MEEEGKKNITRRENNIMEERLIAFRREKIKLKELLKLCRRESKNEQQK